MHVTRARRCAAALVALLIIAGSPALLASRKDDRLVMVNGDQMVGEIKKLEQGELSFRADYMLNSIQVDWAKVKELRGLDDFQVRLSDGRRLVGPIERTADGTFVVTVSGQGPTRVLWSDVVGLLPRETSFWDQLTGNLDSGFSYSSGNGQTQLSASGTLGYIVSRYSFGLSGSSTFSGQSDAESTMRNTISVINRFTFKPRVFGVVIAELLNSEQQELDLRTTFGGALGRWLIETTTTELSMYGGIVYTHEQYSAPSDPTQPGAGVTNNIEGMFGLGWSVFHFKTMQFDSRFTLYPSITTPGRIRLSYAPTLSLEVMRNLYWSFTLYENYDSRPPVNASKNDFGVTNSFGWKF